MSLPAFHWLSRGRALPARWDLRLINWALLPAHCCSSIDGCDPCLLDWRPGCRPADWRDLRFPGSVIVVGVDYGVDRAELLSAGFGDAMGMQVAMVELAARLIRLDAFAASMPRTRKAGPLELDLFFRDARHGETWLGLYPREFALLWRLAETPYARVSRRELLTDVWRMEHVPETNSLEVHVSRLRAKLAISDCAWLVSTHRDGGYQLGGGEQRGFGAFSARRREALDRSVSIGNGVRDTVIVEGPTNATERAGFD